jgi:hypothetical protein
MTILISLILAFILCGVTRVLTDLRSRGSGNPGWTEKPSLGKAFMIAITWFTRPTPANIHPPGTRAKGLMFGALCSLIQFAMLVILIWAGITAVTQVFDNVFLQIIVVAGFLAVLAAYVMPVFTLAVIPLIVSLAVLLDKLFPLRTK